jgi:hypothetical protein
MSHRKTVLGDDPRLSGRERDRMREAWRARQAKRGEPTRWRKLQFLKPTVSLTDGPISVHGAQYNRPHGAPYGVEGGHKESFRGGRAKNGAKLPSKSNTRPKTGPKRKVKK